MNGAELIVEERKRQIEQEGWTPEHDANHTGGELIEAACAYGFVAQATYFSENNVTFADVRSGKPPRVWPWEAEWWKPAKDPVRNLVKAGALIAAEIDRLQRPAQKG